MSVALSHGAVWQISRIGTHDLTLSMLSNDERINTARRHARLSCQGASQTRGVEESAAADDLGAWQSGVLQSEIGENVDGVGDQKKNGGGVERLHVFYYAGEDGLIAADEIGAGFTCEMR
jgi:hypothetical protein